MKKKMILTVGFNETPVSESPTPDVSDEFMDAFDKAVAEEKRLSVKRENTETCFSFDGPAWRVDVIDSETGEVLAVMDQVDREHLWEFAAGKMSRDEEAETYFRRISAAARSAYELYKENWKRNSLSPKDLAEAKEEWFSALEEFGFDEIEYPFSDFEDEQGYGGSLYVCFEEFCGAELQDDGFLEDMLGKDSRLSESVREYRRVRFGR